MWKIKMPKPKRNCDNFFLHLQFLTIPKCRQQHNFRECLRSDHIGIDSFLLFVCGRNFLFCCSMEMCFRHSTISTSIFSCSLCGKYAWIVRIELKQQQQQHYVRLIKTYDPILRIWVCLSVGSIFFIILHAASFPSWLPLV